MLQWFQRNFTLPVILLLLANLMPLYGVWFLGWGVFELILIYWFENVIIGVLNIFKMALGRAATPLGVGEKLFSIPFFMFHYGMFTMVHGVFVVALFGPEGMQQNAQGPFDVIFMNDFTSIEGFAVALMLLVLSHATAFYWDFIRNGAYTHSSVKTLMHEPYNRVLVLHLTIIFGGFAVMALQEPLWALVVMIVIKVIVDIISLRKSEKREVSHG